MGTEEEGAEIVGRSGCVRSRGDDGIGNTAEVLRPLTVLGAVSVFLLLEPTEEDEFDFFRLSE